MTKDELVTFFDSTVAHMRSTLIAKNSDYAGNAMLNDVFSNFTRVESLGIATTEQGFLTRMTDKLCRVASIVSTGKTAVSDEKVTDTLVDLANYSILMAAFLKSKKALES